MKVDSIIGPSFSTSPQNKEKRLTRNSAIGTATGILAGELLLTKGNLKNLRTCKWGTLQVFTLCAFSALGGYIGANLTTSKDKKGRTKELKNQLIYNDFIPLAILEGVDKLVRVKNKLIKSIVLCGTLLAGTFFGHYLAGKADKETKSYPVEIGHLVADADDIVLPIAIATKSAWLQNFLKFISPVTFFPLGMLVGEEKDEKYN